jgi:hypothetical protein
MNNIKSIIPTTIEEAWTQAKYYYSISFVKSNFKSVGDVLFVINLGLELGLPPAQSIQNIAILQGRPTVWGDLMPGLIQGSGLLEKLSEHIEGDLDDGTAKAVCIVKRKGFDEVVHVFSTKDAKRAGLWKYGTKSEKLSKLPWASYPLRMLKIRARTFALRDVFADLLKGLTSREEVMDIPDKVEEKPKKAAVKTAVNKKAAVKTSTKTPDIEIRESNWFKEKYLIDSEGNFHLESGAIYSEEERHELVKLNEQDRVKYHENKLKQDIENNLFIKMIESQELDRNAKKQSIMANV